LALRGCLRGRRLRHGRLDCMFVLAHSLILAPHVALALAARFRTAVSVVGARDPEVSATPEAAACPLHGSRRMDPHANRMRLRDKLVRELLRSEAQALEHAPREARRIGESP